FYEVYECSDGHWVSVAPLEPKFFEELMRRLPIDPVSVPPQWDKESWPRLHALLSETFRRHDRAHWCALLEGTDACFAPVLSPTEAPGHPHIRARGSYMEIAGIVQPSPAPRFSRSSPDVPLPPQPSDNSDVQGALEGWLDQSDIRHFIESGLLAQLPAAAAS
ncbi:MAG: CoA transferase, partial [Desulfobacterales bacterium]|nr:CoA transferase [Desulfobacterales bacterium]